MISYRSLSMPIAFLMIVSVLISTGCMKDSYIDSIEETSDDDFGVNLGVLTNNHFVAPGYDTDFVLVVENIGFQGDSYNISVESKDDEIVSVIIEEGYEQIEVDGGNIIPFIVNVNLTPYFYSTEGEFSTVLKASSHNSNITSEVTLNINTNGTFGIITQIGDSVSVHYAGILAMNGQFFDSSMEEVWDNYPYRRDGVTDAYKHTDPLSASHIGCSYVSTNDGVIFSYVAPEFSSGLAGLETGMEVISINDQEVKNRDDYFDIINLTFANQTINVTVVNSTTSNLDIYHVNLSDMGAFYSEFYPEYYYTWMDGKGFMGINVEDKQELPSEYCLSYSQMIVGFDNKMVGMFEGQTSSVRIPAEEAYGEYGSSDLAGHDLIFEIEMLEITSRTIIIEEPGVDSEKPEDTYSCEINSGGYCIFTGTPHQEGLEPGTDNIVDRDGNYLFGVDEALAVNSEGTTLQARGTPAFDGDQLIQSSQEGLSDDEKAFHKVMAIMFPIRNALMYDIASVNQDEWNALVSELEIREIKETTFTDGATPKDNYYGRQGIFDLAKDPNGRDIHHDVMKFLEESGLYLLCHVTSDDFAEMLADTHPEDHNPCEDAGITTKIPFVEGSENQDYNMTVTEVVDGDTFYLGNGEKVRMLGINTPESGRPYAEEATEFLTNMILGKEVTLVNDSKNDDSDSYGRLLAHVYVNDIFVNYEIIKAGYAFWYPYTSGTDFDTEYEEAQDYASNNKAGLWTESSYNLTIDYIEYNPDGDEAQGEYVVLTNHEIYNVSMVGWYLQDEAAQTAYEFNFNISSNSSIRIYTGDGTDNSTTLFWGWHQGIWNNSGDFAILQDENGYLVDSYRYD